MNESSVINTASLYFTNRLIKRLKAVVTSPLTLVTAPMGYGKTMAVREYLRKRKTRVVWITVLSANEDAFWRDFCQSLGRAFPDDKKLADSLVRLGYPQDANAVDAARELLLQLDFSPETVLVVDDAHLLPESQKNGGVIALCILLARQNLKNLRLTLISRDTLPGRWEMLALKGHLTVIDREAFALNAEEIGEYYALCGLPITPQEAKDLHKATDGWICALYLYLPHYSKDGVFLRPKSIDALLEEEVLSLLPENIREMLIALSPFDHFTGEQAFFLLGEDENLPAALGALLHKNSFITHDEDSGVYTVHSLFRQYLRERFEKLPASKKAAFYSRMADWFQLREDAAQAIEACYAAGEYERALEIMESGANLYLVTGNSRFFVNLFQTCPEEILDRHIGAAFKYAIAAFAAGDYPAFLSQIEWLDKKSAARAKASGKGDPAVNHLRGELEFLFSLAAYNDIRTMSEHHKKAYALLGRPIKLFGPESSWTLGCPSVLFMFHRMRGELDKELTLMEECLPHYYTLTSMHGAGGEHQMRAEAFYYRGEFSKAAIACHQAEAMAHANGQISIILCCLYLRLRLTLLEGKQKEAASLIEEMRRLIRDQHNFFLLHTVDICESRLHAFGGDLQLIPDWLRSDANGEKRLHAFARGYYYITHGLILLLAGEHAAVTGLFSWLLQSGAFADHLMFTIHAHIYTAAASTALGMKTEADKSLRAALDLALPDKIHMPFAENAYLLPRLRELKKEAALKESIGHIQHMAAAVDKARNGIAARYSPARKILTRREQQIARLAFRNMSYKDMAAFLDLAPSTVKRSFASMYKKLGINSREQLKAYLSNHN